MSRIILCNYNGKQTQMLWEFVSDIIVRTDDTTFTLCSVRPHDIFKFKCTAWLLRRCTYVLFTPPQLTWQPNPFLMLRRFVRKASLLLCRVQLRCYGKLL